MSCIQKPGCGGRTEYQSALSETPEPLSELSHPKRTGSFLCFSAQVTGGGGVAEVARDRIRWMRDNARCDAAKQGITLRNVR